MGVRSDARPACFNHIERAVGWLLLTHLTTYVVDVARTSRQACSLEYSGKWAPGRHRCCQNRGRCFPSGSSLNLNGLPYRGVVLSTPQEGPHGRAAIRAALPQGEKLDRRPRPPIAEEPPKPAKPSKTYGQTSRGGA